MHEVLTTLLSLPAVLATHAEALTKVVTDPAVRTLAEDGKPVEGSAIFTTAYNHVVPHKLVDLGFFSIYNVTLFQIGAVVLMFLLFSGVKSSLLASNTAIQAGQVPPKRSWLQRVFAGFVMFIRDEMARPLLGEADTKKYLGHFLFIFFFVMFMNVGGLIPFSQTPTASIYCTLGLALTTLILMFYGGIQEQGAAGFFKSLIPSGVPIFLVPILFIVEFVGLFVKASALMIRLFATMFAGHLVVLSFICLILYFKKSLGNGAYMIAPPAVGLGVFIMIIEAFVTLLQAYIFTYLSMLFVGMCRHPDH